MNVLKWIASFEITSNLQCQKGARLIGVTRRDSVSKPNKKKLIVFVFWFLIESGMENERSQYPNHLFHEILLLRAPFIGRLLQRPHRSPATLINTKNECLELLNGNFDYFNGEISKGVQLTWHLFDIDLNILSPVHYP